MNMQIEAKWNEENKPSPIKEFDGKLLKTIKNNLNNID